MTNEYKIKTEDFEGPIFVLYDLIEKRKLQINTIGLSSITEDFISHIEKLENSPVYEIADFVQIASILILIKSKSLLPILEYTEEENIDVLELEKRMVLYKYIKENAVSKLKDFRKKIFPSAYKSKRPAKRIKFLPTEDMNIENMRVFANNVLDEISYFKNPPKKRSF